MSDNYLSFMPIVISWLPFIIVHAEKFARLLFVIIPIVKVILIKVELCIDGGIYVPISIRAPAGAQI